MKNILVTGGAGFIGSNFIRYLLKNEPDIKIINLDALTYAGSVENLTELPDPTRHHFVNGNILDRELVTKLFDDHKIDTVVHFAAETHVDRSILGPEAFVQTNIVGTFYLLEATRSACTAPTSMPTPPRWMPPTRRAMDAIRWNTTSCRFRSTVWSKLQSARSCSGGF